MGDKTKIKHDKGKPFAGVLLCLSKTLLPMGNALFKLKQLETDATLHSWDHPQVYPFPQYAMVRSILNKLRMSTRVG